MKKGVGILIAAALTLASCKSKAIAVAEKPASEEKINSVIAGHYANDKDFRTVNIKADARYEDKDNTQNVSADIRIRKDEKILVSIRFLGITMAKALITPEEVKYYEKINGEYFEGNFSALSKWLGADLDFSKVQNLLLGFAVDDLRNTPNEIVVDNKLFRVSVQSPELNKSFLFDPATYFLKRQEISQTSPARTMTAFYPAYQQYPQAALPTGVVIEASQQKGKVRIEVDYNNATFNEDLSFPYSVPEGYDRILID